MLTDDVVNQIKKVAANKDVQLCILSAMMSGSYCLDTDLWEALEQDNQEFPQEVRVLLWGDRPPNADEDNGDEPQGLYGVTPPHEVIQKLVLEVQRNIENELTR